jgi:hypothetical protein
MKPNRLKLSVLILNCVALGGCASTSEPERIAPGRVALVAAHYAPAADFNAYAYGRGANAIRQAGKIAGKGAGIAGFVPAVATQVVAPVLPLALLGAIVTVAAAAAGGVVGGAFGLIEGAVNGMGSDQVNAIHQPIERARADSAIQTTMSQHVLALAADLPHHQLTYLPELGPTAWTQVPDYQMLKAAGFESVLELVVTSIGFEAAQAEPPTAVFEMTLRARAVPLSTDARPWTREHTYRGAWRALPEWQGDDGRLFQQELDASYRSLAQFVSGAMFGSAPVVAPAPADPGVALIAVEAPAIPAPMATRSSLPVAGDSWTYRLTEPRRRGQPRMHRVEIESAVPEALTERAARAAHRNGSYLIDEADVVVFSPYLAAFDSSFAGLATAKVQNLDSHSCGPQWLCSTSARVAGREIVRVPAGEFEAIKLEVNQAWTPRGTGHAYPSGARTLTIWYSPQTKRAVKFSSRGSAGAHFKTDFDLDLEDYNLN